MAVLEYTQAPVDSTIKVDMKNVRASVDLSPLQVYHSLNIFFTVHYGHIDRPIRTQADWPVQGVMNADDVISILHHHWVLCNDYYPEERQRLQHAVMNIFCASTTARAGTVIESSCYFGRNEAVEYRDIELYALRDSQYPGSVKLGMLIQLRLLKGRRNRGNPSVSLTKMH